MTKGAAYNKNNCHTASTATSSILPKMLKMPSVSVVFPQHRWVFRTSCQLTEPLSG
jgi:hypothetical protein